MTSQLYSDIQTSAAYICSLVDIKAKTVVVLGTGLGAFAENLDDIFEIPYANIPNFPVSTVDSHAGKLVFGSKNSVPIIVMAGRFHYYEGYSTKEVTFPIRVLRVLGVEEIILTNAAGGINPHYIEGELVMISDHINMIPDHPLRGPNDDRLGLRFPDMLHAYNNEMQVQFASIARQMNIELKHGVYLCLQGPSLETPAEYKMAHIIGADVVGMSTVPEVIVANHSGMRIAVFSIVSNVCFPSYNLKVTTLEDVIAIVSLSAAKLTKILNAYFDTKKSIEG
jgi:purine-nucleoside phosphorylase